MEDLQKLLGDFSVTKEEIFRNWMSTLPSESTKRTYSYSFEKFLGYLALREIPVNRVHAKDIYYYIEELKRYGDPCQGEDERKPLSTAYVNKIISSVRSFYDYCILDNNIGGIMFNPANPVKLRKPVTSRAKRKEAFSLEEVIALIDMADNKRDKALIALMADTGIRTIEVYRANWEDIGTSNGLPTLDVQRKGSEVKEDFVHITASTFRLLMAYKEEREPLFGPEPLFTSVSPRTHGDRLTTRSISWIVKELKSKCMALGQVIDPNGQKTAHSLRHFFGTEQMGRTGRLEEVADDMGHHSTENTKRYSRKAREESRAKRAVDFFEGRI
ncbi:MAG: tyrosine-type recombinase/integrase [Bacteroidia bacterium]|nr:tyrosine-type recombinase/integrase [Bacteroidia bacterium]